VYGDPRGCRVVALNSLDPEEPTTPTGELSPIVFPMAWPTRSSARVGSVLRPARRTTPAGGPVPRTAASAGRLL